MVSASLSLAARDAGARSVSANKIAPWWTAFMRPHSLLLRRLRLLSQQWHEVRCREGILLLRYDPKPEPLRVGVGSADRVAGEVGVGRDDCNGLRLRVSPRGHLEETSGERGAGRSGREQATPPSCHRRPPARRDGRGGRPSGSRPAPRGDGRDLYWMTAWKRGSRLLTHFAFGCS